jgi:hypothetical protein
VEDLAIHMRGGSRIPDQTIRLCQIPCTPGVARRLIEGLDELLQSPPIMPTLEKVQALFKGAGPCRTEIKDENPDRDPDGEPFPDPSGEPIPTQGGVLPLWM